MTLMSSATVGKKYKRSFFSDKDFTTDGLLECEKQCSSSISSKVFAQ